VAIQEDQEGVVIGAIPDEEEVDEVEEDKVGRATEVAEEVIKLLAR